MGLAGLEGLPVVEDSSTIVLSIHNLSILLCTFLHVEGVPVITHMV